MRRSLTALVILFAPLAAHAAPPKPLAVERIALSQFEDGPTVGPSYFFVPGETAFLSFHVAGYKAIGEDEPRVSISYIIQAFDPAGIPVVETVSAQSDANLDPEDKDWTPKIRRTIALPPHAVAGSYEIQISVTDRVGGTQASAKTQFRVKGRAAETVDKLTIRDFHFYRGESDERPMTNVVYHPGDSLWARFEIAGYKLGEKNAFEVGYGLAVLRPNGEQLFRQPDAAVEKDAPFYPRRFLPAGLSLNLDKTMLPGKYTLVVLAHDKVAAETIELRQEFAVE